VGLTGGHVVLVKWNGGAQGMFSAEQRGLALLAEAGALRVPAVYGHAEPAEGEPGYIALEWLGQGASSVAVETQLGQGLARLHRRTGEWYGLDHDNFIGANPQPNRASDDWLVFFGEQRLGYQLELLARNNYLPGRRGQRLERLLARLGEWLPARTEASLLHGDLWGGNWITTAAGEPALIDPAVYYGHREAELAFTELFGGFSATFYAAYNETWPLDGGYTARKDIYNLYHLMNHVNLFGEGYGGRVDSILARYVG
jgi:fructosamine-3-kinase